MSAVRPLWRHPMLLIVYGVIVALVLLYICLFIVSEVAIRQTIARADAAGHIIRPSQLRDRRVGRDGEADRRFMAAVGACASWPEEREYFTGGSASRASLIAAMRPRLADLLAACGPDIRFGVDWAGLSVDPDKATPAQLDSVSRMGGLSGVLRIGRNSVVLWDAGEPAGMLALDHLHVALQEPESLLGALIGIAVGGQRDAARLRLIAAGTMDAASAASWLRELPDLPYARRTAQGLVGDRCLYALAYASHYTDPDSLLLKNPLQPVWPMVWPVMRGFDFESYIEGNVLIEGALRGVSPMPEKEEDTMMTPVWAALLPLSSLTRSNKHFAAQQALHSDLRHRLTRIAALIMLHKRATGHIPINQAAVQTILPAGSLSSAGPQPAIAYERLGPSRFRVGLDPSALAGIGPPWELAKISSPGNHGSAIGRPPDTKPLVNRQFHIEVDMAKDVPVWPAP